MKKIKVLIVDDSIVYRSQIRAALESIELNSQIAVATNGRLALERLTISHFDLVILDLEMPEMDGLQTLKEIQLKKIKSKILVFSSQSQRGAEITMDALKSGATDFATKPDSESLLRGETMNPARLIRNIIEPKIKAFFNNVDHLSNAEQSLSRFTKVNLELMKPKIVVIGASTGGPTVIEKIFTNLKIDISCPILISQHMPPLFTKTFSERLAKLSGLDVKEAVHGETLSSSTVYVAPGDQHLKLVKDQNTIRISLDRGPMLHSVRPAVDHLFVTAAEIFKQNCLGIVLTGMGNDGRDGSQRIKETGGCVVIQDQASCVVFGMPGSVFNNQSYDHILNPDEIISLLQNKCTHSFKSLKLG